MKFYYLSTKCNFEDSYVIHERECQMLPDILERDYLGPFNNGQEALRKAVTINKKAVICESCGNNLPKTIGSTFAKSEEG